MSPDGKHIITASADKTARVWDLPGTQIIQINGHQGNVLSAQFSADSRF
ncbi:WD40 repeat domain-containing protein [Phormidesmis priestleyi]